MIAEKETNMAENDDRKKKALHRSPAYPSVNLKAAIALVDLIYSHEKRAPAPVGVVAQHCGTDIKSSKGLRVIAALKQFGLVIEEGTGDDRQVRLSDRALDIIFDEPKDAKAAAIKAAALAPPIHRKIWDNYGGDLPSDASLRSYLLRQLDFNDVYVDKFVKQFRATLAFAAEASGDIIAVSPENSDTVEPDETDMDEQPATTSRREGFSKPTPPPAVPKGTRDFPLYTSGGARGALFVPDKMSPEDFKLLKTQIENSLIVIEATGVVAAS